MWGIARGGSADLFSCPIAGTALTRLLARKAHQPACLMHSPAKKVPFLVFKMRSSLLEKNFTCFWRPFHKAAFMAASESFRSRQAVIALESNALDRFHSVSIWCIRIGKRPKMSALIEPNCISYWKANWRMNRLREIVSQPLCAEMQFSGLSVVAIKAMRLYSRPKSGSLG